MGTSGTVTHGDGAPEPEADGSPVVAPPEHRGIGIRIFSSASDAPRARRPTDVVLLIVAVVILPDGGERYLSESFWDDGDGLSAGALAKAGG